MNCVLFAKMDQVFSRKKIKITGNVRGKSGNFVSPEKWEPCLWTMLTKPYVILASNLDAKP